MRKGARYQLRPHNGAFYVKDTATGQDVAGPVSRLDADGWLRRLRKAERRNKRLHNQKDSC